MGTIYKKELVYLFTKTFQDIASVMGFISPEMYCVNISMLFKLAI